MSHQGKEKPESQEQDTMATRLWKVLENVAKSRSQPIGHCKRLRASQENRCYDSGLVVPNTSEAEVGGLQSYPNYIGDYCTLS